MKRFIIDEMIKWKNSKYRKPLIIRGARQVGKTWVMEELGKYYPNGYVKIDFDRQGEFKQFFQTTKEVDRIIHNLSIACRKKIDKDTLIIFDEIQNCPEALNSLKYFCEDAPYYHIVCAGSLLGIELTKGFPVGKVDFMNMGPMSFTEFLLANGDENLVEYMDGIDELENISDFFFNPLVEKLKMYYIIGGMPEAVNAWVNDRDIEISDKILNNILDSYMLDFFKHVEKSELNKVNLIWDSLPSQLARENKKFLYSAVKEGARAREYEDALNWLKDADLVEKIYRISRPGLPISAYDDLSAFKIYLLDVGLLRKKSKLDISAFYDNNRLFSEFKGALTENYVLQSICNKFEVVPRYWANTTHEVDFIIQLDNYIIPVETKGEINVKTTNIRNYNKLYEQDTQIMVRLSLRNLSLDGKILNVPLFMADYLEKLIRLGINKLSK